MTNKTNKFQWSLKETETYVSRDLSEANVYHHLLFNVFRPLALHHTKELQNFIGQPIHFLALACESAYVLSMAKVFAEDREQSLDRLIQTSVGTSEKDAEKRLTLAQKNQLLDYYRNHRAQFLANADSYKKEIRRIRKLINPLRNAQRAHNFPDLAHRAKVTWVQFEGWLRFAERVCYEAAQSVGESALAEGDYLNKSFETDTKYLLDIIQRHFDGKLDMSQT